MRALLFLALSGCAVGAPPGFGKGESWSVPLVAPLEDDLLLVPVHLHDRAEAVLFMIDPDSAVSSIDNRLVRELKLYSYPGQRELNELDRRVPVFLAEVKKVRVGELEVANRRMRVHRFGTFWAGGRLVRGILGRDVVADSLMFSADRDRGIVMLATQGSLSPPPQATVITYRNFFHRRIAPVKVNRAHVFDMHIDLGARTTMLWGPLIQKAGLPKLNVRAELQDEYGTSWQEDWGGLAAIVEAGDARADALVVLPFGDKRLVDESIHGALGQNFLSRFNVTVNWHERTFWLKRRTADLIGTAGERLRRWGKAFAGCERPACVQIELVRDPPGASAEATPATSPASPDAQTAAGAAAPSVQPPANATARGAQSPANAAPNAQPPASAAAPSAQPPANAAPDAQPAANAATDAAPATSPTGPALREIRIVREPRAAAATYEVLLEAVSADGRSLGLPRLRATLLGGAAPLSERDLAPEYGAAAAFLVLDASPFARECEGTGDGARCLWKQSARM